MCKALDITIKPTTGESPWRNGLVEGNNLILAEMLGVLIRKALEIVYMASRQTI